MQYDGESIEINMFSRPCRTLADLQQILPQADETTYGFFVETTVLLVLSAVLKGTEDIGVWDQLESLGFRNLLMAMDARDMDQVRQHVNDICRILQLDGLSDDSMEVALDSLFRSNTWNSHLPEMAETEDMDTGEREPSQGLRGLLYYIAEEDAKRKAYEHRGIHCEECRNMPIRGIRWHCLNCPDFDLCAACEMHTVHPKTHVFAKIKIPLPVLSQPTKEYRLWYPGDPRKIHAPLDTALKTRLCQGSGFLDTQLDALYDQFTCIANVPWESDATNMKAAIDKRAFNKAMTCEKWSSEAISNPLYDRMFSFYDTDGNALIGFEEFISGLAYLRGPRRFASLQRALQGYDMNGDGYLDRADFLRLLRAKFGIQEQLIQDQVEGQETEQTQNASDTLRSSQPISSIFSQDDIPFGETRPRRGKQLDGFGDMLPFEETKTILDDDDPWPQTAQLSAGRNLPSHQRLHNDLSRFEELLHGSSVEGQRHIMDQVDGLTPLSVLERDEDHSLGNDESSLTIKLGESNELSDPHIQDILWKATEDGINEMLDPLFKAKEREDEEAISTRQERGKWRQEIDTAAEHQRRMEKELEAMAVDTIMIATAMTSSSDAVDSTSQGGLSPPQTGGIVPTDWENLERREQDISDIFSLRELLSVSGYGLRDTEEPGMTLISPRRAHTGSSTIWNGDNHDTATSPLRTVTSNINAEVIDPTLPQNMPEKETSTKAPTLRRKKGMSQALNTTETSPERPPSRSRLHYLRQMDKVDQRLQDRGGPGRLTYNEIETMTLENGDELRGIIKSWLEWASF